MVQHSWKNLSVTFLESPKRPPKHGRIWPRNLGITIGLEVILLHLGIGLSVVNEPASFTFTGCTHPWKHLKLKFYILKALKSEGVFSPIISLSNTIEAHFWNLLFFHSQSVYSTQTHPTEKWFKIESGRGTTRLLLDTGARMELQITPVDKTETSTGRLSRVQCCFRHWLGLAFRGVWL